MARVSCYLNCALESSLEGTRKERQDIVITSLAHDSLEDTDVDKNQLLKILGSQSLAIVEGMTNTWGDDHPIEYVEKIITSSEAVRLVKISDMIDNLSSVAFNLKLLGIKWADEYFSPIVEPMSTGLIKTDFITYSKTAKQLMLLMQWAKQLYDSELEFCRIDQTK